MSLSRQTMAAIRFGYGIRPGESPVSHKDDLLAQVLTGAKAVPAVPAFPREGLADRWLAVPQLQADLSDNRKEAKAGTPDPDERKRVQQKAERTLRRDSGARVIQAAVSPNGFHERLASFWVDHFSVAARKTFPTRLLTPLYEAEVIRPLLGGKFSELLTAAVLHPAMLIYLDQSRSVGPGSPGGAKRKAGLNENLAREMLELHTLGAGSGYTQNDVRAAAMVLTGLTVDNDSMRMEFRRAIAEPGRFSVLGATYGSDKRTVDDALQLLADLAARPETMHYICRKLVAHFIADEPPEDVMRPMREAWMGTGGDLTAVYAAMLDQPRAWSDEGQKIKLPFDYVVSGLRALNAVDAGTLSIIDTEEEEADAPPPTAPKMVAATPDMAGGAAMTAPAGGAMPPADGKVPMAPANGPMGSGPAKPPAQTKSAGMAPAPKKQNFARALTTQALVRMGQPVWQPPSPAGFEEGFSVWVTPSQLAERIGWARQAARRLAGDQDPRDFLKAVLADAARENTIRIVGQAPNRLHAITMILASPEFNRR
jgi:uncharacterized protein (DUF1800 family)